MKKGMVKATALYPNGEGHTIDIDYYCLVHLPMVAKLMGDALKGASIEKGLSSLEPGSAPPFLAVGHWYFDSMESFQNAFGTNVEKITADVPNYTNIEPQLIISEVMV